MKVQDLFEKAQLPKSTHFTLSKLEDLKGSLWKHGLSARQIQACLNNAFAPLMVEFTLSASPKHQNQYTSVGLDGAGYSSDGWITVNIINGVTEVLNGNTDKQYQDFVNLCGALIVHELRHREQVTKHKANGLNGKHPDRVRDYLLDHREMDSFAAQCAIELLSFFSPNEILNKASTSAGLKELKGKSEVLNAYVSVFRTPSNVMNKFLKKVHSVITHFNTSGLN